MDFNLQAYQADHLLHLSAKPERRVSVLENARHRWLEMDGVVQSAMSLHQPARLCLPHQRSIAEQLPKRASRILELGLGGGDLTRHLAARWPDAHHDCVDLDAEILTLFQQFFLPSSGGSPRLHHADALHFLHQSQELYDLVLLDLFSQDGNPLLLFQAPLYQALASRLSGTLIINLLPRTRLEQAQALRLAEEWIGPTHVHDVSGYRNVILHATRQHGQGGRAPAG
ncbi:spermidine synthase [Aeromonas caviae]|uniref:spermidine synthase n=1 Tax=Aeromonas TaxID=642 RepID=UPI001CC4D471|nr:methyltransferase domain-containing protein [Aeromonas caviae]MEB6642885.1 SAM-dependent methyltransferase [Aeromonas caviae]BDS28491.1 SAM-dependent methyltransferase [Aeromonas caviae]GJA14202.1 SAM-dependent methyltransferase [Aeromonas caviae]GJA22567.1 SAM-dependent methyltransferase [Aeromonas caviae]GJB19708.1 SAM-dependent methyltransferase [Aeromonas caviae]